MWYEGNFQRGIVIEEFGVNVGLMDSIKQKVFSGTMWMAAVSVCQEVLQFVVQIVLARLLLPHDYGVAAIAATICSRSCSRLCSERSCRIRSRMRRRLSREEWRVGFLPRGRPPAFLSGEWFLWGGKTAAFSVACLGAYLVSARLLLPVEFLFVRDGLMGLLRKHDDRK